VALDIFCEGYTKVFTYINFTQIFVERLDISDTLFSDGNHVSSHVLSFTKNMKINITRILKDRHIER